MTEWTNLPLLSKEEIENPADPMGLGRHHSYESQLYTRFHRTSGTMGRATTILDSANDWNWWLETWQFVLDAAEITPQDRVLFAFSFGPFIGFWSAFEACLQRGAMAMPAGGLTSLARIELLRETRPTVLCCTPSYALHLHEVAQQHAIDLRQLGVKTLIVSGEPGGSVPEIRQRLMEAWGATILDHAGATEIGPWGFGTTDGQGLHVIETEFYPEFLPLEHSPNRLIGYDPSSLRELVLTSLGRFGCPVLRYRTGDIVCPIRKPDCSFIWLKGGILGRIDDMLVIRGVNFFPSSLEAIVRTLPTIHEYRVHVERMNELDELTIQVEASEADCTELALRIQNRLGLRTQIQPVSNGSLPRFPGKARRIVDSR